MIIGNYRDGRVLEYDERTYGFAISGAPIAAKLVLEYDRQGSISWKSAELRQWFLGVGADNFDIAASQAAPVSQLEPQLSSTADAPGAQGLGQASWQPAAQTPASANSQSASNGQMPHGTYAGPAAPSSQASQQGTSPLPAAAQAQYSAPQFAGSQYANAAWQAQPAWQSLPGYPTPPIVMAMGQEDPAAAAKRKRTQAIVAVVIILIFVISAFAAVFIGELLGEVAEELVEYWGSYSGGIEDFGSLDGVGGFDTSYTT